MARTKKLKVYYAHPIGLYDKNQESYDIGLLNELGFAVENPNQKKHQKGCQKCGMEYFADLVQKCDALAFRAFPDGSIGAGIMKEIQVAKKTYKPVIELPCGLTRRGLTVEQTREVLWQSGAR